MEGDAPANTLVLALVEGNAEDNSFLQEFIAKDLQCIFRGFDITLPLSVTELCDSSASTSAPSVEPVAASTSAPSVEPVAASTCAPSVPAGKSKRKSRALPRVEPVQVNAHNIPQCWCSSDNYLGSIECEHCHRQFHPECVGIDDVPLAKSNHWQCLFCCEASVPVPIHITYDVPNTGQWEEDPTWISDVMDSKITTFAKSRLENTSFALSPDRMIAQAITPEQFSIRLHAPSVCDQSCAFDSFMFRSHCSSRSMGSNPLRNCGRRIKRNRTGSSWPVSSSSLTQSA